MGIGPRVYVDTNIVRDLAERREQSSLFLQELASGGEYLLIVSPVFIDETFLSLFRQARERIEAGEPPHEVFTKKRGLMGEIIEVIKLEGIALESLELGDRLEAMIEALSIASELGLDAYDALHVVLAVRLRADFLATRDRDLLRRGDTISGRYGVRVVEPRQLVPAIYWSLERVRGTPVSKHPPCVSRCLAKIESGGRPSLPGLILLSNYLRRCLNYGRDEIHAVLRSMRGYDPRKTDAALAKYVPLVWWCNRVKEVAGELCPYTGSEGVCEDARPLAEDEEDDQQASRVDIARARPSPFYFFIRKALARRGA